MTQIQEALEKIQSSGAAAAKHERCTELIKAVCQDGLYIRQGDVILTCTSEAAPKNQKPSVGEIQLAPGETKGSRHMATGSFKLYRRKSNDPLRGPLLLVTGDDCIITHPEHRHYKLPKGTRWSVTYERDLAAEERARVQD